MSHALKDVLVVALEQAVAAPIATSRLADAGARVIKLERPDGDFARGYDDFALGQSSYFVWMNRGKESCRVDLNTAEDRALVETMIAKADVFIQNLAPGATDRLGIGSKALRARYPRLIVCDVSGYAPGTPSYYRKAYDLLIQAEVGLAHITGTDLSGPSRVGISICDITTGQAAYGAILEAIIRRDRTGEGSHLQVSLFDTIADYMNVPYLTRRYGGREPSRLGLAHPSIAPYGSFTLKDGSILIAVQSEREWQILCADVLHDPALAKDERFDSNVKRVRNRAAVDACVQKILAERAAADVTQDLNNAKIAFGMVSTMGDLLQHQSAVFLPIETEAGTVEVLAPPVIIDGERPALGRVPRLGEHDEALRREFAPAAATAS
ncbi:CaiB/BaiF CoA transferase family protein [Dongia sp.]|uniref:CaiB/BaiF CoA transferase family protein n=1 Tax=Dongia sp. TaxID=1977262 RepID=UPI0035AF45AF